MNEIIKQKFDEFKERNKCINTDWFERFFNMLEQVGIDEELILRAADFAFNEENFSKYAPEGNKHVLSNNRYGIIVRDEFFKYMSDMAKKLGKDGFREFLESSIVEMEKDYNQHKQEQHSKKTTFINLFMRRLIIKNPQDVKLEFSGTKVEDIAHDSGYGSIDAVIAGVSIGHLHYEREETSNPIIAFTEFRTLPGLERLSLGTYIFTEFCKQVSENEQEYAVIATNVAKGKDGSKAYSAWGGYPVNVSYTAEKGVEVATEPMTDEEYQQTNCSLVYYFSPKTVKNCSQKVVKRYSVKDNEDIEQP